ncbi:hypothetical protein CDAR_29691 [Caerostris darwini]|uniref:Uncharacterized protein n=1 Tax=Caerostris darwini TaxID=1538125 RepID=A0AAV4QUA0_9ARAC|nr:hypothetical protein CDAR_29691 [Caerostris darwini]
MIGSFSRFLISALGEYFVLKAKQPGSRGSTCNYYRTVEQVEKDDIKEVQDFLASITDALRVGEMDLSHTLNDERRQYTPGVANIYAANKTKTTYDKMKILLNDETPLIKSPRTLVKTAKIVMKCVPASVQQNMGSVPYGAPLLYVTTSMLHIPGADWLGQICLLVSTLLGPKSPGFLLDTL